MDTNSIAVAAAAAATALSAHNSAAVNTAVVAIFGFLGVLVTTIGTIFLARIHASTKDTATTAHAVVEQTASNSAQIINLHDVTRRIYAVVNKPFGVALETAAQALEVNAALPGATPDHIQAAATARLVSNQHAKAMLDYEMNERIQAALTMAPVAPAL